MRLFVTGGAGFIGSNYVHHVLATSDDEVTVYDALAREGQVRLPHGLRQRRGSHQLHEPAALVLEPLQRDQLDALDHLLAPFARTKSLTS